MFAHDGKRATEILRMTYFDEEEARLTDTMDKKHKEFVDFVIKDLIAEIATESAVTLEFMDRDVRSSLVSFNSLYDEEHSLHDLGASHLSVSTDNLIH